MPITSSLTYKISFILCKGDNYKGSYAKVFITYLYGKSFVFPLLIISKNFNVIELRHNSSGTPHYSGYTV